jgi:hypothetical protein
MKEIKNHWQLWNNMWIKVVGAHKTYKWVQIIQFSLRTLAFGSDEFENPVLSTGPHFTSLRVSSELIVWKTPFLRGRNIWQLKSSVPVVLLPLSILAWASFRSSAYLDWILNGDTLPAEGSLLESEIRITGTASALSFFESVPESSFLFAFKRAGAESEAISILAFALGLGTAVAVSALSFFESGAASNLLPDLEVEMGAESEAISIVELALGITGSTSLLSFLESLEGSALLVTLGRTGATSPASLLEPVTNSPPELALGTMTGTISALLKLWTLEALLLRNELLFKVVVVPPDWKVEFPTDLLLELNPALCGVLGTNPLASVY